MSYILGLHMYDYGGMVLALDFLLVMSIFILDNYDHVHSYQLSCLLQI